MGRKMDVGLDGGMEWKVGRAERGEREGERERKESRGGRRARARERKLS